MAIAFVVTGDGLTQEDYVQAMRAIGREDLNSPFPEGAIAHISGPTNGGWRVVDVWKSEEEAHAFYGSEGFQTAMAAMPSVSFAPWRLYRLEVEHTIRSQD